MEFTVRQNEKKIDEFKEEDLYVNAKNNYAKVYVKI